MCAKQSGVFIGAKIIYIISISIMDYNNQKCYMIDLVAFFYHPVTPSIFLNMYLIFYSIVFHTF